MRGAIRGRLEPVGSFGGLGRSSAGWARIYFMKFGALFGLCGAALGPETCTMSSATTNMTGNGSLCNAPFLQGALCASETFKLGALMLSWVCSGLLNNGTWMEDDYHKFSQSPGLLQEGSYLEV